VKDPFLGGLGFSQKQMRFSSTEDFEKDPGMVTCLFFPSGERQDFASDLKAGLD
jgi:hypothetical protein